MRDVTIDNTVNKSVNNFKIVHHVKFQCILSMLNKIFNNEIKSRGGVVGVENSFTIVIFSSVKFILIINFSSLSISSCCIPFQFFVSNLMILVFLQLIVLVVQLIFEIIRCFRVYDFTWQCVPVSCCSNCKVMFPYF